MVKIQTKNNSAVILRAKQTLKRKRENEKTISVLFLSRRNIKKNSSMATSKVNDVLLPKTHSERQLNIKGEIRNKIYL